ncbi:MAG: hypothetical protein JO323_09830 [Acidobacteriia bacterium]|nr:hypothetical protein [Terriglobia bacterium]
MGFDRGAFGFGRIDCLNAVHQFYKSVRRCRLPWILAFAACQPGWSQVNILTANGDNNRTNANLREIELTPENVIPGSFGKIGTLPVDGQVYAQPLYASNLAFPDGSVHNVVFLATMHNSVYAYDADKLSNPKPLWQVNLGPSFPPSLWHASYSDISPEVGILGTGVIDPSTHVLYIVAQTLQNGAAVFDLHALDLFTGAERMNGPVPVTAEVNGSGAGTIGGNTVTFDPNMHLQRPGLLLANQVVHVGFGSHMDDSPWHGWIISYNASDLTKQTGVFMSTPNGEGGAFWQSGRGLAADDNGNIFSMTGNGDFDGAANFAESFIKLSSANDKLVDWFTPANWADLSAVDADLSTGTAIIPGTHNLVGGDKAGQLYLVNGDAMGNLSPSKSGGPQILSGAVAGGMFNFALWSRSNVTYLFAQGEQDVVTAYAVRDGAIQATAVSAGINQVNVARVGLTISADGDKNGILWETTGDSTAGGNPGTLHAFNASNLATELWNSDMNANDALGTFSKFGNPTVANGRVYVPTFSGSIVVYGSLCSNTNTNQVTHLPSGSALSTGVPPAGTAQGTGASGRPVKRCGGAVAPGSTEMPR